MSIAPIKECIVNHSFKKIKASIGAKITSLIHTTFALKAGILSMHLANVIPDIPTVMIPAASKKIPSFKVKEATGFLME